jgi:hypothetical protein
MPSPQFNLAEFKQGKNIEWPFSEFLPRVLGEMPKEWHSDRIRILCMMSEQQGFAPLAEALTLLQKLDQTQKKFTKWHTCISIPISIITQLVKINEVDIAMSEIMKITPVERKAFVYAKFGKLFPPYLSECIRLGLKPILERGNYIIDDFVLATIAIEFNSLTLARTIKAPIFRASALLKITKQVNSTNSSELSEKFVEILASAFESQKHLLEETKKSLLILFLKDP